MNRHRIAYNKLASITPDDEEYYIAYSDDDGDDYYDDDDDRRWPYYYDEDDDDDDDDDETEEEEETSVAASASAASSSSRHVTWAVQTASSSSSFSQSISSSSSISPSSSSSSAAAATPSKSCRSRSQRQNSNETVAFFVQQTWKLVNEAKTNHFVCWGPTGDSIIIANVERFTKVLPRYFKHNNYPSFQRRLNSYGFRTRRASTALDGVKTAEFYHKSFLKGRTDLLAAVRCGHDKRRGSRGRGHGKGRGSRDRSPGSDDGGAAGGEDGAHRRRCSCPCRCDASAPSPAASEEALSLTQQLADAKEQNLELQRELKVLRAIFAEFHSFVKSNQAPPLRPPPPPPPLPPRPSPAVRTIGAAASNRKARAGSTEEKRKADTVFRNIPTAGTMKKKIKSEAQPRKEATMTASQWLKTAVAPRASSKDCATSENSKTPMLLQQRVMTRYHGPGVVMDFYGGNKCCIIVKLDSNGSLLKTRTDAVEMVNISKRSASAYQASARNR